MNTEMATEDARGRTSMSTVSSMWCDSICREAGPLDEYRAKGSFDRDEMARYIYGKALEPIAAVLDTLKNDSLFKYDPADLTLEEHRKFSFKRWKRFMEYDFISALEINDEVVAESVFRLLGIAPGGEVGRAFISMELFAGILLGSSLHPHIHEIAFEAKQSKLIGCFTLTEMSHGSNAKALGTMATYDPQTEEFVLHTPSFDKAKCWAGSLGLTASYAVVFAQLYTPDGVCHGLHSFVVPIRDRKTLLPFDGVIVGDMGKKIGLNGLDNGYMLFDHYRIPRDHLLNRNGDVTPEGRYVSPFKDPNRRFGAQLGILSGGRVAVTAGSVYPLVIALTIAIRYSVARKQFGPPGESEWPVIEYQLQYWRLVPYVAASYVWRKFAVAFQDDYRGFKERLLGGDSSDELAEMGKEIHAVSSSSKPFGTWMIQDGLQECREACGGHGYLTMNQIGKWRDFNDSSCTYEGENNVILKQTGNYLLSFENEIMAGATVSSPLGSMDVFNGLHGCLASKCDASSAEDFMNPKVILAAYKWLVCYLFRETVEKTRQHTQMGKTSFEVKNDTQVYFSRSLSLAYVQHFSLVRSLRLFETEEMSASLRVVLMKMFSLFGLWALQSHIASLSEGNYFKFGKQVRFIRDAILQLCLELKDDSVTLVDAFSVPDFAIQAPIGFGGGDALKHLFDAMVTNNPQSRERVSWWQDVVKAPEIGSKSHLVSKL